MLGGHTSSPVKESSYLARSASMDDGEEQDKESERFGFGKGGKEREEGVDQMSISPPPVKEELPIRR